MNTRFGVFGALAAACLMAVAGCGGTGGGAAGAAPTGMVVPDSVLALYDAASAEGTVSYWQSTGPVDLAPVIEAFEARFPGITVDLQQIQPQEGVEKIISEGQAGSAPNVDLLQSSLIYTRPLVERDMLAKPGWTDYGVSADETYFDGSLLVDSHLPFPFTYNPEVIDREAVPTTWDGLRKADLDGGRLIIESRGFVLAYLSADRSRDEVLALTDDLLAKRPLIIKGSGPLNQSLSSGEAQVAVGSTLSSIELDKSKGARIDWVAQEDFTPVMVYGNVVLEEARHPNAARLLAWWLNSPEGIGTREATGLHTPRLTGQYIPAESQALLDSGANLVFEDEEGLDATLGVLEQVTARFGRLG